MLNLRGNLGQGQVLLNEMIIMMMMMNSLICAC